MKNILFFFILMLLNELCAQNKSVVSKPVIDTTAVMSWPELGDPVNDDVEISMDGKFISYKKKERWSNDGVRILQSVDENKVLYTFPYRINGFFSRDSKRFIYSLEGEIVDLDIRSGRERKIKGASEIGFPRDKKGEILFYRVQAGGRLVIEYLLEPDKKLHFDSVSKFVFYKNGGRVAFVCKKNAKQIFQCVNMNDNKKYDIQFSKEDKIEFLSFDNSGSKVLFVKKDGGLDNRDRSIWIFDFITGKFELRVDRNIAHLYSDEFINSMPPRFSQDGHYIFFKSEKLVVEKKNADYVRVDVWNYRDLQLKNGCRLNQPQTFTFSVAFDGANIVRLENDSIRLHGSANIQGDFVIVYKYIGDRFWEIYGKRKFWVVSMKDGTRSPIVVGPGLANYSYSPGGRYLVYGDSLGKRWDYYAYDTKYGKVNNLTKDIPQNQLRYMENNRRGIVGHNFLPDVVGWVEEDNSVLVYDSFDVLKLYLFGEKRYENITNGYGRRNNTRFVLTNANSQSNCFGAEDTLLFTAFNWSKKYNGFYSKRLNKDGDPDSIAMKPWIICGYGTRLLPINDHIFDRGMIPLKAVDANVWLVKCNSEKSAPNYYLTPDLIKFKKITNVQPHTSYNWYTTQLVHWKQYDSTIGDGILFKPENFDSSKKYPLIIFHYRELSQLLHHYSIPELTEGPINIPWFVSRGYLVLVPDVYVQEDGAGPGAFNSVVSAAEWAGTLSFVDKQRIGLTGHSQAGFQTNYIIAHTSVFAAALAGAGGADAVMSAFVDPRCGSPRFPLAEGRIGSIWEWPENYIKNSPFWLANKVTTPLLIFHCKKDDAVPWELSLQFFLSLWRLEKPVWMLQYEEGGHAVTNKRDLFDYSLRVDQFFDHFLRDSLPPIWMTRGVSPSQKGGDSGLELDNGVVRGEY